MEFFVSVIQVSFTNTDCLPASFSLKILFAACQISAGSYFLSGGRCASTVTVQAG